MHLHSSPAYSISTSVKQKTEPKNIVPGAAAIYVGPGAYATDKAVSLLHNPTWKIGTDKRDHGMKSDTPGPGAYEQKSYLEPHPITMQAKPKEQKVDEKPGPGAYEPRYNRVLKNEPGFTLGSVKKLSMVEHNVYVPGPGAYETLGVLNKHTNGVKFGSQKRLSFDLSKNVPGPGSYYDQKHANLLNSLPKYSFGHGQRNRQTQAKSPGRKLVNNAAGQYDTKGEIETLSIKKKGYSMSHLKRDTMGPDSTIPGPGAYNIADKLTKTARTGPSYSMGHSNKGIFRGNSNPGPLDYVVKDDLIQRHDYIAIGKSKRQTIDIGEKAMLPGPGSYNNKSFTGLEGPKYTIVTSKPKQKGSAVPGPGAYEPHLIGSSQPRPVIGKGKRSTDIKEDLIGPGHYNPFTDNAKGKGFTIGNEKRDNLKPTTTPGPGQYDVSSTLANVPKYSLNASRS